MTMRVTLNEFLGTEGVDNLSPEVLVAKMTLDFQADAFLQMKKLGIKQKDLASILNISPAAVSKLLSNGANLRLSSIARIASALKCDVISPRLVTNDEQDISMTSSLTLGVKTERQGLRPRKPSKGSEGDDVDQAYRELCAQDKFPKISARIDTPDVARMNSADLVGVVA